MPVATNLAGWWLIMKRIHEQCHVTLWPPGLMSLRYKKKQTNISSSAKPMATRPDRVVTYDKRNSPVMWDEPLITWSCEVTWLIQSLFCPFLLGLWPPNMRGCWLMVRRNLPMESHDPLKKCWKCNITCFSRPMAMKVVKMVTYGEVNVPIKSLVLLTTWLRKVTWQTKNRIFLPSETLWPPNFAGCLHMVRQSPWISTNLITWSQGHVSNWKLNIFSSSRPIPADLAGWLSMTLWPCSLVGSHEKLKTNI